MSAAATGPSAAGAAFPGDNGSILYSDRGDIFSLASPDAGIGTAGTQLTSSPDSEGGARYSADGQLIAYGRAVTIDPAELETHAAVFVMNADGSAQTRLTPIGLNSAAFWGPAFSPDGQHLAVIRRPYAKQADNIWSMSTTGGDRIQLTHAPRFFYELLRYSPDGARLGFSAYADWGRRRGNTDVFTMTRAGSDRQRLTSGPATDLFASFSPDGRRVLFSSDRTGRFEIYRMRADGTHVVQLTGGLPGSPGTDLHAVAYSPDGQEILAWSPIDQRSYSGRCGWILDRSGSPLSVIGCSDNLALWDWGPAAP